MPEKVMMQVFQITKPLGHIRRVMLGPRHSACTHDGLLEAKYHLPSRMVTMNNQTSPVRVKQQGRTHLSTELPVPVTASRIKVWIRTDFPNGDLPCYSAPTVTTPRHWHIGFCRNQPALIRIKALNQLNRTDFDDGPNRG